MKCILCGKMLRGGNINGLCSSCNNRTLGTLLKEGIITVEWLRAGCGSGCKDKANFEVNK